MINIGDMVGFEYRGEVQLAIITEDLGKSIRYGRFTGLVLGTNGDLVPLNPEELTVLTTEKQVEQWEKKKNLKKLLDKKK